MTISSYLSSFNLNLLAGIHDFMSLIHTSIRERAATSSEALYKSNGYDSCIISVHMNVKTMFAGNVHDWRRIYMYCDKIWSKNRSLWYSRRKRSGRNHDKQLLMLTVCVRSIGIHAAHSYFNHNPYSLYRVRQCYWVWVT